ncbi:hypothetical protein CAPTEDRAFT_210633 [Capitella teleta]|uniref:Uncharacterized protein n=1 Tax=Capitella teleta TaxID=283909 RepID=R7UXP3_CAPTE|nr:hypothetical protein CAPTEDRAFT_210633 [Capitella teleta]|eukprot:ELU11348.1 hypothetical protein CAPTEDRAFT_210633 [Capitella teleta]
MEIEVNRRCSFPWDLGMWYSLPPILNEIVLLESHLKDEFRRNATVYGARVLMQIQALPIPGISGFGNRIRGSTARSADNPVKARLSCAGCMGVDYPQQGTVCIPASEETSQEDMSISFVENGISQRSWRMTSKADSRICQLP